MPRDLSELQKLHALSANLLEADNLWRKEQIQFLGAAADDPDLQGPELQGKLRTQIEEHKRRIQDNEHAVEELRKGRVSATEEASRRRSEAPAMGGRCFRGCITTADAVKDDRATKMPDPASAKIPVRYCLLSARVAIVWADIYIQLP